MNKVATPRQAGFGHVVSVAVIVLVLAVVGHIGYTLYADPSANNDVSSSQDTTSKETATPAADAPAVPQQINNSADLDKAASALDQIDAAESNQADESSLDSELRAF